MSTYVVEYTETQTHRFTVKASSEVEAIHLAELLYEDAERQDADELDVTVHVEPQL